MAGIYNYNLEYNNSNILNKRKYIFNSNEFSNMYTNDLLNKNNEEWTWYNMYNNCNYNKGIIKRLIFTISPSTTVISIDSKCTCNYNQRPYLKVFNFPLLGISEQIVEIPENNPLNEYYTLSLSLSPNIKGNVVLEIGWNIPEYNILNTVNYTRWKNLRILNT